MRAVGLVEFGGPEVLKVIDVPETHAGPGEVRLRVHAAAVSPTDTMARSGARAEAMSVDPPPYIPGMDAAGVIDEVGEGVDTGVAVGDNVIAIVVPHASHGAYRQSIVLPAKSVAAAPAGASHAEASTLPMNGLTARMSLDLMGLSAGQTIAVTGAAGAYGGYMVQLAKADGLRVIADSSDKDTELVKALGADVIVPRGDDVAAQIRKHAPDGVDGLADGSIQNELVIPAVKDGGAFTSVRGYEGNGERGINFTTTMVRSYYLEHAKLDQLRQQVEDGAVTLRVAGTVPADNAAEAHRRLEAGGSRGRWVIEF